MFNVSIQSQLLSRSLRVTSHCSRKVPARFDLLIFLLLFARRDASFISVKPPYSRLIRHIKFPLIISINAIILFVRFIREEIFDE